MIHTILSNAKFGSAWPLPTTGHVPINVGAMVYRILRRPGDQRANLANSDKVSHSASTPITTVRGRRTDISGAIRNIRFLQEVVQARTPLFTTTPYDIAELLDTLSMEPISSVQR
jgi:hypothetical protein